MVKTTPVPAVTVEPISGVTAKTVPCGLSEGVTSVRATTKPTEVSTARASPSNKPTNPSGTMASPGPSEIVITTAEPFLACVDATGNWLETRSMGICGSGAR